MFLSRNIGKPEDSIFPGPPPTPFAEVFLLLFGYPI
jgi:hypothetical protein